MLCGHVRVVKATGGRLGPEACPGHWLVPSNRLSSQLSGWGPLVRAVRAPVLVVAVEPLAGQQEEDLARGRDGSTSIPLSSTVSHFFSSPAARVFVYPLIIDQPSDTQRRATVLFSALPK